MMSSLGRDSACNKSKWQCEREMIDAMITVSLKYNIVCGDVFNKKGWREKLDHNGIVNA